MNAARRLTSLALAVLLPSCWGALSAGAADPTDRPRNVIVVIPDGCGPAAVGLARMTAGQPLTVDSILVGALETHSASSRVTDSAAAGTALATGVKTANTTLGVDPAGLPVGNLIEAAAARGLATGVVTTASVTDATPAAFTVHLRDRHDENAIALQLADRHVDVLLGGGRKRFLPREAGGARTDGRDLLAEARRAGTRAVVTRAELAAATATPLLGLFATDGLDPELDRDSLAQPSLTEMAEAALTLLERRGTGFLLVLEGAHIDDVAHDNDPAALAHEVLACDRAVAAALAFARRDGRTLIVVSPDHETGGLTLGRRIGGTSYRDMTPDTLRGVHATVWRMADSILAGANPVRTAERGTGFRDLSADERQRLRRARGRNELLDTLSDIESRRALVHWGTGWHTAVDVGLWAWGPGSERFRGLHENTDVARIVAELLGLDLGSATARVRAAMPAR